MGVNYNPKIVTDGLQLYLDAANSKSYPGTGTTWHDLSSLGGNAIAYNSPTYNINGYFNSDGTNDYFRITRNDLNGGSFSYGEITCELWYMPSESGDTSPTSNNIITVERSFEISVGNNENGYHSLRYASNPWAWYGPNNVLKTSKWNMIVFVHKTSGRWLYVNGIQVFYSSNSGNIAAGDSTYPYLTLMGRYSGTTSTAEGNISSVKLYNRGLSINEIKQNFNATRSRYGV